MEHDKAKTERLKVDPDCKDCRVDWLRGPDAAAGLASGNLGGLLTFTPCPKHSTMTCGCVLHGLDRGKASMTPCPDHAATMLKTGGLTLDFSLPPAAPPLPDAVRCPQCHPLAGLVHDGKLVARTVVDGAPAGTYRCPNDHVFTAAPAAGAAA